MELSPTVRLVAEKALDYVSDGATLGLGTGRAAMAFIQLLGAKVQAGLRVRGVATSERSAELARSLGIPLTSLAEAVALDLAVDGADEVLPGPLHLIKGYGGALVREKIVAASARNVVIVVSSEKLVDALGQRGKLPVEVVPFGLMPCRRALEEMGLPAVPRTTDGQLFFSDNGNNILDCIVGRLSDPVETQRRLRAIPGIVDTGLFLGMAHTVLVQRDQSVEVLRPTI